MKRALALRQERAGLTDEVQAILTKADTDSRAFTAEESATLKTHRSRVTAIDAELTEIQAASDLIRTAPSAITTTPVPAVAADAPRVSVSAPNAEQDPKRGFRDHREFLTCVRVAGASGRVDERLRPLAAAGSDEQGSYSDPHGGFLVPVGVAPGILSIGAEGDPLAGLVTSIPMSSVTVKFNARVDKNHSSSVSGGLTVSRTPETVDGTPSRMSFEQVTLTATDEVGLAYATENILVDSPESFTALIAAGFADEFGANAMKERVSGTGVGERQGYLTTACKIAVAKEAGQSADTIVTENIDKMAARCWRYSQSVYVANQNTRPALRGLVRVVGTGGSIVPYFMQSEGRETLDGRPIIFTEFAKTVGDEGDLALIVPSQYLEGTYQGQQFAESIHVRFAARERAFRFYRRNDGQWWWRSALTPKNGDTLSPVVTLAAR